MSGDEVRRFRRLSLRIVKATVITVVVGIFWLIMWLLISLFLADYPEYLVHFAVLAWASLFFTFATKISEGTIYKYILIITRSFFLIMYIAHATNCGTLTIKIEQFTVTIEFIPIIALITTINLLAMAKGLLQAIEFASKSPKD
ncbi:MAG: hypothetical protein QXI91_01970 [Candidatus Bathyarchaeia archaeon]